ncbi:MAG: N-6 DNA methylase [Treponema sp.]|nr:N-6 DNA methylase [Candidatus Treponema equifaecale]
MANINWTLEDQVNDFVKDSLNKLNLKNQKDFNVESNMSGYMKESLKGSAKTKNKTNFGKPDFHIEKYKIKGDVIPVVFEDKLHTNKLISVNAEGIKNDEKSISAFAVNGAIYYATQMIASGKYNEVIAIGVAGDSSDDVKIDVYFVYGSSYKTIKQMSKYQTFDFLENQTTFDNFYRDCTLTDADKHELLIRSKAELSTYAKELNKLMHNHNITAPQRVLYVSGMLLSMQDIKDDSLNVIQEGLISENLKGVQTESKRDGILITSQIDEFLKAKGIPEEKRKLMIASFNEISKDKQRDEPTKLFPQVSKFIKDEKASANKQIFVYIYENIYKQIDAFSKNLDIMGELYSEFLKYALGDGKELGIVLTPPYVTKMMAQILNITYKNKVMDLATGSAGFLISSMELMINSANEEFTKGSSKAKEIIEDIKKHRLLGVELNAEMFTLAATNMILRGDGSSNIQKGSSFDKPDSLYTDFNADRILLNPPFTFEENGMPFISYGLDRMQKGGFGAIIIQDSAGSGKAVKSNKQILKNHTLVASIKMPVDLFQPMAGVQTSIYIFEAGTPHDYEKTVKFIDFSNDGYKRTSRSLIEQDEPIKRYSDIIKIFKSGKNAKSRIEANWDLDATYTEDFITDSGTDWNFGAHIKIDTKPTLEDFKKTVADYLSWEVSNIIKNNAENDRLGK